MTTDEAESQIKVILADAMHGFNATANVQAADVRVSCPGTLPDDPETAFTCDVTVPGAYEPLDGTIKAFIGQDGKVEWCSVTGQGWSMVNVLFNDVCSKAG